MALDFRNKMEFRGEEDVRQAKPKLGGGGDEEGDVLQSEISGRRALR